MSDEEQGQRKSRLTCEAVDFAFNRIAERYDFLCALLLQYPPKEDGSDVVAMAWDVLDWVEKLRKLLEISTGFNKRESWYTNCMQDIRPISDVRHFIQHADREIRNCLRDNLSFFGFLSAYVNFPEEEKDGWTIVIAQPKGGRAEISRLAENGVYVKLHEHVQATVDNIQLKFGTHKVNLSVLTKRIEKAHTNFMAAAENYLYSPYEGKKDIETKK